MEIMLILQIFGAVESKGLQMMEGTEVQRIPHLLAMFSKIHFVIKNKNHSLKSQLKNMRIEENMKCH